MVDLVLNGSMNRWVNKTLQKLSSQTVENEGKAAESNVLTLASRATAK